MTLDCQLERLLTNGSSLDEKLIGQHHCRGNGQTGLLVFRRPVSLSCFGDGRNLQIVFYSQPGNHIVEAVSGFPSRIIEKNTKFNHYCTPVS